MLHMHACIHAGNLSMVELPAGATSVEVTHHPLPNNGMLGTSLINITSDGAVITCLSLKNISVP